MNGPLAQNINNDADLMKTCKGAYALGAELFKNGTTGTAYMTVAQNAIANAAQTIGEDPANPPADLVLSVYMCMADGWYDAKAEAEKPSATYMIGLGAVGALAGAAGMWLWSRR